jgi:recombination protein RecR
MQPDALNRLVAQLAKLPGIGEKTAQRLAFHILRAPPEYARELSTAIGEVKAQVHFCSRCYALTDMDVCKTCLDPRRDERLLCVVEGIADLVALERTREFKGRYHVLHGVLSPLEGVGPEQLRIKELLARLEDGRVEEVILATNPDVEG